MVQYLGDMARIADRIAEGDLTVRVEPRTDRDAFGRAFVSMVGGLSEAMHALREGAEAITTASTEVASSSRDLSESTTRHAERVERTVSTLDDVRASAARSAEDSIAMQQVTLQAAREAVEVGAAVREMAAALQTIVRRTAIVAELASETAAVVECLDRSGARGGSRAGLRGDRAGSPRPRHSRGPKSRR